MKKHLVLMLCLLITVCFLWSCAGEEPVHKNMPVSVFIKNIVKSQNDNTVDQSIDALIAIGAPAVPYIQKAWKKNESAEVHCRFSYAIEGIGPAAVSMLPQLTEALNAVEEERISCAAYALGGFGEAAAPVAEKLGALLKSSDTSTQSNILYALGGIGPKAADQIPLILEAVEREKTRDIAIQALSNMGPKAVEAVDEWLESGNDKQRLAACQVLSNAGQDVAIVLPSLKKALGDKNPQVRLAAVKAIGQAGPLAMPLLDDLILALKDRNDEVHQAVIQSLADLGPEATEKLIAALDYRNARIRTGAARVIGRYTDRVAQAKKQLIQHLSDSDVQVRLAVIDALTLMGKEIVPTMTRQLKSSNVLRKFGACRVLGNIGDDAKSALPEIKKLLSDKDSVVREEAQRAYSSIKR